MHMNGNASPLAAMRNRVSELHSARFDRWAAKHSDWLFPDEVETHSAHVLAYWAAVYAPLFKEALARKLTYLEWRVGRNDRRCDAPAPLIDDCNAGEHWQAYYSHIGWYVCAKTDAFMARRLSRTIQPPTLQ